MFVNILSAMTEDEASLLRKIAFNCIDRKICPDEVVFWDFPDGFFPRYFPHELAKWFKENERKIGAEYHENNLPNVDLIYDDIINAFGCPGVSLIHIMVTEIESNRGWDFSLLDKDLPPAAYKVGDQIDILCALQVLAKHNIQISNARFEVDLDYVCMTSLGFDFLQKCDHEWAHKLRSRDTPQ